MSSSVLLRRVARADAVEQLRLVRSKKWRADRAALDFARGMQAGSRQAEARYVLDLVQLMRATTAGILKVVETEHLDPPLHLDASKKAGLGDRLVVRLSKWQRPKILTAYDRMAGKTLKTASDVHVLHGINPHGIVGVDSAVEHGRERNVALITNATKDFLDDVNDVLEEHEGDEVGEIRKALKERVGISERRAKLIAVDQTLKLHSQVNEHRQRSAGLAKYRWSTSRDSRVAGDPDGKYPKALPSHWARDGKIFSWDSPPDEDDDDGHPGANRPLCRCIAVPFVEELDDPDAEENTEAEEGDDDEVSEGAGDREPGEEDEDAS